MTSRCAQVELQNSQRGKKKKKKKGAEEDGYEKETEYSSELNHFRTWLLVHDDSSHCFCSQDKMDSVCVLLLLSAVLSFCAVKKKFFALPCRERRALSDRS